MQGFAASSTTNGSLARSSRVPYQCHAPPSKEYRVRVAVPRPLRILDSIVQPNPMRSQSSHRCTVAVPAPAPRHISAVHTRDHAWRAERRLQPRELRHRADPAADRAAERVRATVTAHRRRRVSARRRPVPPMGCGAATHRASRSVSLPSSDGSVPSRLFAHMVLRQRARYCVGAPS